MNINKLSDSFLLEVAKGNVPKHSIINKFGYNNNVGTSLVPICSSGTYQTPIANTSVEAVSDSVNDTAGGTGINTISVQGINLLGEEIAETVALNGIIPVALVNQFFRIFRIKSLTSGTYANSFGSSHTGEITIQTTGGGAVWGKISSDGGLGLGQSQIGVYTIPAGKRGFILAANAVIESTKTVEVYLFQRNNADIVTAPFDTMRLLQEFHGTGGNISIQPPAPIDGIGALTDIGVMGKTSLTTSTMTVSIQLLLIDE